MDLSAIGRRLDQYQYRNPVMDFLEDFSLIAWVNNAGRDELEGALSPGLRRRIRAEGSYSTRMGSVRGGSGNSAVVGRQCCWRERFRRYASS